jgi:hypothetical protein
MTDATPLPAVNRRALLRAGAATVPVALAGCTTDALSNENAGGGDAPDDDTPAESPDETPRDEGAEGTPPAVDEPRVRVTDRDEQPTVPIRYEAEMVAPLATADHPPRLRVSVTNTSDHGIVLGEERAVKFHHLQPGDGALYLLPAESGEPTREPTNPGCWRLTEPVAVATYYGTISLGPGETRSAESALYGHWELPEDRCLPAGDHRVENSIGYGEDSDAVLGGGNERFDWGFTLAVEND